MSCIRCGSHAINPLMHGRDPAKDADLCDVCYWRTAGEQAQAKAKAYDEGTQQIALYNANGEFMWTESLRQKSGIPFGGSTATVRVCKEVKG